MRTLEKFEMETVQGSGFWSCVGTAAAIAAGVGAVGGPVGSLGGAIGGAVGGMIFCDSE